MSSFTYPGIDAKQGTYRTDYFYIRGCNSNVVLDAKCPGGDDCNFLHLAEQSAEGPLGRQEWCLFRFSWSSLVPFPSPSPTPPSLTTSDLPRRQFFLQNVASGGYTAAIGLSDLADTPNVIISGDTGSATRWYFMHQPSDQQWAAREDLFAIVTRTSTHLATLDHYYTRHIQATYRRFGPQDPAHSWRVLPARDGGGGSGAFVFANRASGKLLAQAGMAGPLAMAPQSEASNDTCHWRLIDAATGEVCRVLYDSGLTIVPPELAGTPQAAMPTPTTNAQRVLRTKCATGTMQRQFVEGLKHEHETIREMLRAGYTSLVVAPQLVRGWKGGKVHEVSVAVRDEEDALGVQRFRGKGMYNFERCERR